MRSGGIVFLIAIVIAGFVYPNYLLAVAGAALIGIISFFHDRYSLSWKIRLPVYMAAVLMMFQFLPVFIIMPWWVIIILCVFVVCVINAYSFIDQINGTTSILSLIVLGGLQYVNINVFNFVERDLIWLPIIACVLFLLISVRNKSKWCAGDVGSVTLAFWVMFLLLRLILDSGNFAYILFLAVYGLGFIWKAIS